MGNKLLNEMLLHMYKQPQCEHCVHPHTAAHATAHGVCACTHVPLDTKQAHIHICMCVHIEYVCTVYTKVYILPFTYEIAYIVDSAYE